MHPCPLHLLDDLREYGAARDLASTPRYAVALLASVPRAPRRRAVEHLCTHVPHALGALRVHGLLEVVGDDYVSLARLAEADDANAAALEGVVSSPSSSEGWERLRRAVAAVARP